MKIYTETSLETLKASLWSGAVNTLSRIIDEGKADELEAILEDLYPNGLSETELNDILWFEPEWVYEMCGITEEEEEDN